MRRRQFIQTAVALSPAALIAQTGVPQSDPVERMTVGNQPIIALSHVGFRPDARKRIVVSFLDARSFELRDIGSGPGFRKTFALNGGAGDFTEVSREGLYQVQAGSELSPPFFIRPDAWRRHLPMVVSYHKAQRCGVAVPNVHPACHLDDARRRDNGQHVDTTGGWHDAGDLRKWMDATMMNAFGLMGIARNLGSTWDAAGSGIAVLNEELRWGNRYFLKMQDSDGRVFADVAGGVNGDNSDNHWTDNIVGTPDDRYLNPAKGGSVQAMFTALQAIYSDHFRTDTAYSAQCLQAARRCWDANQHVGETEELSWWLLAAIELFRATHETRFASAGQQLAEQLIALQRHGGPITGYWPMSAQWDEPFKNPIHGALPAFVLLEAAKVFAKPEWRNNVRQHIEGYVEPMMAKSTYGFMPFGIYKGSPTPELYRPLTAGFTYRNFMPVRKQYWWLGLNSHLASFALLMALAGREFNQRRWTEAAWRQLEWMVGANPFGCSMISAIGVRNPFPHSRYVGVIPGGVMNGICGNEADEPVMDMSFSGNWRTNEYWSPQVGYLEWTLAVLEAS